MTWASRLGVGLSFSSVGQALDFKLYGPEFEPSNLSCSQPPIFFLNYQIKKITTLIHLYIRYNIKWAMHIHVPSELI